MSQKSPITPGAFLAVCLLAVTTSLAEDIPRSEPPRPDFAHEPWLSLNGAWLFRTDPENIGLENAWHQATGFDDYQRILVPYPWESRESGLSLSGYRGVSWYRRIFEVPTQWQGSRIHLVFGAVDQEAEVWLNGAKLTGHAGGYTPFEREIGKHVRWGEENELHLRVVDQSLPDTLTGNQGGALTPSSGIWQSVHLEARPSTQVSGIRVIAKVQEALAEFTINVTRLGSTIDGALGLVFADEEIPATTLDARFGEGESRHVLRVPMTNATLWTPQEPHLYDFVVSVATGSESGGREVDRVRSYFGMREVKTGRVDASSPSFILLNGKPLYLRGVSSQAWWPGGLATAVSDSEIEDEVKRVLESGYNAIRIERKIDDPRFYYWCDRLGLVVVYGFPDFARPRTTSRARWERTVREAIRRDFDHPSILAWVLFEESRGLTAGAYTKEMVTWVQEMVHRVRALDPTRPVIDNATSHRDHVDTDVDSFQFLLDDFSAARDRIENEVAVHLSKRSFNFLSARDASGLPIVNLGYSALSANGGDRDISFTLHFLVGLLRKEESIAGSFYRQLSDVEWQHNGLFNYDRSAKEFGYGDLCPGFSLRTLNGADFLGFSGPSLRRIEPGTELELQLFTSHFSHRNGNEGGDDLELQLTLRGTDDRGARFEADLGSHPARWAPYRVVELDPIRAQLPAGRRFAGSLSAILRKRRGDMTLARNFIQLVTTGESSARVEAFGNPAPLEGSHIKLRFLPGEAAAVSALPLRDRNPSLLRLPGAPRLEYRFEIPECVPLDAITGVGFEAELAALGDEERLSWPDVRRVNDHPQTDGKKSPVSLKWSVAGYESQRSITLDDAPNDIRGSVSLAQGYLHGLYGYLVVAMRDEVTIQKRTVELRLEVDSGRAGLAIFGADMGRYLVDPALILNLDREIDIPEATREESAARDVLGRSVTTLLETGDGAEAEWLYSFDKPPGDWTATEFDEEGWLRGRAGFGSSSNATATEPVETEWEGPSLWLRNRFSLEKLDPEAPLFLRIVHPDEVEVHLNGVEIFKSEGALDDYETLLLPTDVARHLREGENIIAVSCRRSGDAQRMDLTLLVQN